jgi:hypothetical protein
MQTESKSERHARAVKKLTLAAAFTVLTAALCGCTSSILDVSSSTPTVSAPPVATSRSASQANPSGATTTGAAATPPVAVPSPPTLTPPPAPVLPFDEAVAAAADALFSSAKLPPVSSTGRYTVVIDPLIEGTVGAQLTATRSMEARITDVMETKYPQYKLSPFTTEAIAQSPLVLLGSFTGVDRANKPSAAREVYRIWLVLANLKSGQIVARGVSRASPDGVDLTPTLAFTETPVWLPGDPATKAYLKTCEGKIGEPIDPAYLNDILAAALIADAVYAFDSGKYREALALYESAATVPGGDQLRVYNGLYLAN